MKPVNFFKTALIGALVLMFASCDKSNDIGQEDLTQRSLISVTAEGVTTYELNNICPVLDATNPLTADEIEFLFAIREDEKLSKDLYSEFATRYSANIQFSRIARAEANHIAAIERVFGYYEVEFPALAEAGVFSNSDLQGRYDEALAKGATALDAFVVMASIEEANIDAYGKVLQNAANANLKLFLENMVKSSSNHLRASARWIAALGGSYTPAVLEQSVYDEIINTPFSQGNRYGEKNGKGGKGSNTNGQKGGKGQGQQGGVNGTGTCTNTTNGTCPGTGGSQGNVDRGYRGGR